MLVYWRRKNVRWLLIVTERSNIAIRWICTLEWLLLIVHWGRLLPRRLSISLRLLPPLIVPSLMHVLIVAFVPYNKVVTTLIAKGMRIHSSK
ncbi:hypothetical protein AHAS_Ahas19G0208000 [Arachis hypogaea]